jgi:hypothetical protein
VRAGVKICHDGGRSPPQTEFEFDGEAFDGLPDCAATRLKNDSAHRTPVCLRSESKTDLIVDVDRCLPGFPEFDDRAGT